MKNSKNHKQHSGNESHLLKEIVRTNQVIMTEFSRCVGVTSSRLAIMRLIAGADEDVGMTELARQLGINAAAVTRQLKNMEGEGLISRREDPKDGRRGYVRLSPKGQKQFNDIHDRAHKLERALSTAIGTDEIATAVVVLTKVRDFIEGESRGNFV